MLKKPADMTARSSGFTLIELLAVPGVLSCVVRPAWRTKREARRAKRSIRFTLIELLVVIAIITIHAYVDDHDDNLPWLRIAPPYFNQGDKREGFAQYQAAVYLEMKKLGGSLHCPIDRRSDGTAGSIKQGDWWKGPWENWFNSSYAGNSRSCEWMGPDGAAPNPTFRMGRARRPSHQLMFTDGNQYPWR